MLVYRHMESSSKADVRQIAAAKQHCVTLGDESHLDLLVGALRMRYVPFQNIPACVLIVMRQMLRSLAARINVLLLMPVTRSTCV